MSASPITGEAEDLETFTVTLDAAELAVPHGLQRGRGRPAGDVRVL